MKIKKVLNNNAIIALNDENQEIVITGLGIAFNKKNGETVDKEKIERVFKIEERETTNKIQRVVESISIECLGVAEDILKYAEIELNAELNKNAVFVLADHISFAIERFEKNIDLKNPLEWEVKQYYIDEYKVGMKAIEIIKKALKVQLPEQEAASIALHLVNARVDETITEVVQIVNILQDMINIIKYHFLREFDDDELSYQRLVNHLKFFAQSVVTKKSLVDEEDALYDVVKQKYKNSFDCVVKIRDYAKERYDYDVSDSEMTFLIVHVQKVVQLSK